MSLVLGLLSWVGLKDFEPECFHLLVVASLLASFSRVMKASILKVMSEESWVWRPDNGKTRSSMDISEEFLNAQIRVILHFFFLACCDHNTDNRDKWSYPASSAHHN